MLDREKHRKVRCVCGQLVSRSAQGKHEGGAWHRRFREARELLAAGLSKAEIARQLGLSRAWASQRLR